MKIELLKIIKSYIINFQKYIDSVYYQIDDIFVVLLEILYHIINFFKYIIKAESLLLLIFFKIMYQIISTQQLFSTPLGIVQVSYYWCQFYEIQPNL